jgi:exopolysaccharide biosynthesis predicted pyruvyltransferase EpsI
LNFPDYSTCPMAKLSQLLLDCIAMKIPLDSRVALVGYPRHTNVGDNALWLGARAVLRRLRAHIVYCTDVSLYDREEMARLLGDGIIVIQGGGNIGDLWPTHQAFRERVLTDFPNNRVIQLPQSIHFDDPTNIQQVRNAFHAHRSFTLFVRDQPSAKIAKDMLGLTPVLAPDLAFALWPMQRVGRTIAPYVFLRRTDHEAAEINAPGETFDWLTPGRVEHCLNEKLPRAALFGRLGAIPYGAGLDQLCRIRVRRGIALLSRGHVVISDRLHGVLLSVLAGIPVVAIDNRVSKLSAFIGTWFRSRNGITIARDADEAILLAERIHQGRYHYTIDSADPLSNN